jgi:hypothetical protein
MEIVPEKMQAQLRDWGLKIDRLAAKALVPGARPSFDALVYVDELKVLHAIAQAKMDELTSEKNSNNIFLQNEMMSAWNDLRAAVKDRKRPNR